MSRLSVPNLASDTGAPGQVYAQIKKAIGARTPSRPSPPTAPPP
jgi:hypothetical protein